MGSYLGTFHYVLFERLSGGRIFSCADGDLVIGQGRTLKVQRESFMSTVLNSSLRYFRSPIEILE